MVPPVGAVFSRKIPVRIVPVVQTVLVIGNAIHTVIQTLGEVATAATEEQAEATENQ